MCLRLAVVVLAVDFVNGDELILSTHNGFIGLVEEPTCGGYLDFVLGSKNDFDRLSFQPRRDSMSFDPGLCDSSSDHRVLVLL